MGCKKLNKKIWNIAIFSAIAVAALAALPLMASAGIFGSTGIPGSAFGLFDTSFAPFASIPGNMPGPDYIAPGPDGVFPPANPELLPKPAQPKPAGQKESLGIFINNIFLNEPFSQQPGSQVEMRITFENSGNKNLEGTKVIAMIPELSARAATGPFDISAGRKLTKTLLLDLPEDVQPGTYTVRLQIHSERPGAQDRIVHREIEIIDHS